MRRLGCIAIFVMLITSSCASISGHKVVRDSDGDVKKVVDVKGMPIVVQTPTLAIFILSKSKYDLIETPIEGGRVGAKRKVGEVIETELSKEPIFLGPSEIYTIDPKRPAAGTIDYEMDLDNQYPKKIKGKVEDATIEQLRSLVKDLVDTAIKATGLPGAPEAPSGVEKEAGRLVEKRLTSSSKSLVIVNLVNQNIEIKSLD